RVASVLSEAAAASRQVFGRNRFGRACRDPGACGTSRPVACERRVADGAHLSRRVLISLPLYHHPPPLVPADCKVVAWYRCITHLAREGRMTVTIGRREMLVALGGAVAWPLAARERGRVGPSDDCTDGATWFI